MSGSYISVFCLTALNEKSSNRRNFIAGLLSVTVVCTTHGAIADSTKNSDEALDSQLENLSSLTLDDHYKLQHNVYAHNMKLICYVLLFKNGSKEFP